MNVPMKWLHDFVNPGVTPQELAYRLTMAGLEVEKIDEVGAEWNQVFVGRVLDVSQHPDADRLVLADVEAGEHRLTVVTGAPNIYAGQTVALALAGAALIDGYSDSGERKVLKPTKMRGILSAGMVCSEKELGLSGEHEGILSLDDDAPVGAPLQEWLGDTVLEFEITPNLVHDFSVYGIARETAALYGLAIKSPEGVDLWSFPDSGADLVQIEDDALCPRYIGIAIDGVTVGPSPGWMARRLQQAGLRTINNIVDVTNFVMLELGQPLHAFDSALLDEGRVVIRRAHEGETIETLDHEKRDLTPDMLVIADANKAVAVAGVMGGVDSEVSEATTSILLEGANFDMKSIRHTARQLRLRTDASVRFERGLDPNLAGPAMSRAAALILQICPNAMITKITDAYPGPVGRRSLEMAFSRIERVLGIGFPEEQVLDVLARLEFEPSLSGPADKRRLTVSIPTYRNDVSIPDDIVEEVARVVGYDALPSTLPTGESTPVFRDDVFMLQRTLRAVLVGCGLSEAVTYVTISSETLDRFLDVESGESGLATKVKAGNVVRLVNPLQAERSLLRPTVVPSLLESVSQNLKHETSSRLFEFAKFFLPPTESERPSERNGLAIAMAGQRDDVSRFGSSGDLDFFDLKGVVEVVLERSGLGSWEFNPLVHSALHPHRAAMITSGENRIGVIGELHPDTIAAFGISGTRAMVAEIDLDTVLACRSVAQAARVGVPRFLPVEQDFAIVVDTEIPSATVEAALRQGGGPLVSRVVLFDVYEGEQIGAGKRSLAFRVTFTAPDRALTDADLIKIRKKIEKTVAAQANGTLRA